MYARTFFTAASLALATAGAGAQEFCVTCTGPDAAYRCLIAGDAPATARSSRGQFLCITALAKAGGHASCSAARAQATACPGETRTVMFPADLDGAPPADLPPPGPPSPPAPAPQEQALPSDTPRDGKPAPAEAQPKTVEELAKKTGEAVGDTGNAVGEAMKKTWNCVTSLFGDC